jgi:hypothetical protein
MTSTGAIHSGSGGITIHHDGLVTADGAITNPNGQLFLIGNGVVVGIHGSYTGGSTSIAAGSGDVAINGAFDGTNIFVVTGANFSSSAPINGMGMFILNLTGQASIGGAVNFSGLANLSITGSGPTSVTANITSDQQILIATPLVVPSGSPTLAAGEHVMLGNVTGPGNLTLKTAEATGLIEVGAIGTSPASRAGNVTFLSANLVQLGGNIFAGNVSFQDNLSGTRADVPTAATIYKDGSLTIDAAGTFSMEQNQKLSVHDSVNHVGNLTIKTNHQTITVGDLSALGKIVLDTGDVNSSIRFLQRAPQHLLLPNGSLSAEVDKGTDIVAGFNGGGAIFMRGSVNVMGGDSSHRIQFSAVAASDDIAAQQGTLQYVGSSGQAVVPLNQATGDLVGESQLLSGATVLDLIAKGISGTSPQSTVGTVIPRDVQTLQPERGQAISGALRDALRELGIYARDLRTDEVIEYLIGRALYDDVPYKLDPGPTDMTVAANRLPFSPVLPTVDAYRKLFFKQEVDEKGKPVYENGKAKMVSQDSVILRALGEMWQKYSSDKGDEATAKGFRTYLEEHEKEEGKFAAALDYLNQLRDLLARIRSLGLTQTEFEVSQKVLLSKVRPQNIREEDFLEVITGPSSRGK